MEKCMKIYNESNVFEESQKRIEFLFNRYQNIIVSFSGGKDSTVCLNLVVDYARKNNLIDRVCIVHEDFEAQYDMTTEFVDETFKSLSDIKHKYWLCLPFKAQNCCSLESKGFWRPWNKELKEIWVRELPNYDYVVTEENCPFKFNYGWWDKDLLSAFSNWFSSEYGKSVDTCGIRAEESYDRYMLVTSGSHSFDNHRIESGDRWIVENELSSMSYPIYDWTVEDVWVYFAKSGKKYNKLYDLYYKAGLSVDQMRVASPFNNQANATLKFYKCINPSMWGRMVSRVQGANFVSLYGDTKLMGWRDCKLPKNYTWKTYCEFLLNTCSEDVKNHFIEKFTTSINYWCKGKGAFIDPQSIDEIHKFYKDIEIEDLGESPRYKNKHLVRFKNYPDDLSLCKRWMDLPSYKRMCVTILKNDYCCQSMGFSPSKRESEKRKIALEKFKEL